MRPSVPTHGPDTMLTTQRLLREDLSLPELQARFSLRVCEHPELPLVILNYDQIESRPKTHPVVSECRGLVLERGSWNVVARAIPRFFATGEVPDCDKTFEWANSFTQEKHDGSLVLVYKYGGKVFVNTRGSFGHGPVHRGTTLTWRELFLHSLRWPNPGVAFESLERQLPEGYTAVLELCSTQNRIVRYYPSPVSYLLTVFDTVTGEELAPDAADNFAASVGARRPDTHSFTSLAQARNHIASVFDPTFEGFVVRSPSGRRKKIKSGRYEALHRVKCGVESPLSAKTLAPFIATTGDDNELIVLLGSWASVYRQMRATVDGIVDEANALWVRHRDNSDQKAFALAVAHTPMKAILFEARKRRCEPSEVWVERGEEFVASWLAGRLPAVGDTTAKPAAPDSTPSEE